MKKIYSFILLFVISAFNVLYAQNKFPEPFNLGFEEFRNGLPAGWNYIGNENYRFLKDSVCPQSGKYCMALENLDGNPSGAALGFDFTNRYESKTITLTGYIKTEGVDKGFAALFMRLDPGQGINYMSGKGITGTTEWRKYEISLPYNRKLVNNISFGVILNGTGKVYADSLNIFFDGINVNALSPYIPKAAQDRRYDAGSEISHISLKKRTLKNLQLLGYIWGFVKYYHPNVADGQFNMDNELFRFLPVYLQAKNREERDTALSGWLRRFGRIKTVAPVSFPGKTILQYPDLEWIGRSGFSRELISLLDSIKCSERSPVHYYVSKSMAGNPVFNEIPYENLTGLDPGFRLLALYRYWNIIQYFYPYKNLTGENWKKVLKEFIPRFIGAGNATEYAMTVLRLITRIHDTHAYIANRHIGKHIGGRLAPVKISRIEKRPVITESYLPENDLNPDIRPGDIITKIDNKNIKKIIREYRKLVPASNKASHTRDLMFLALRTNDTIMNINLLRRGRKISAAVPTYLPGQPEIQNPPAGPKFKIVSGNIAYIDHADLTGAEIPEIMEQIKNTWGLIIDARTYPANSPMYDFLNYLTHQPTPFCTISTCSIIHPGLFELSPPYFIGKNNTESYKGKVLILVNENTQSRAEFHALAYRSIPGSIILGSQTAGADGDISHIILPGNFRTGISGIGIYTPDGLPTQRKGIVPDIKIRPTIQGIREGKDELLLKAAEIIRRTPSGP